MEKLNAYLFVLHASPVQKSWSIGPVNPKEYRSKQLRWTVAWTSP